MTYNTLYTIYETMNEGLYLFDKDGKIIHMNAAACKLLGFEREELIDKIGHFIFHSHKHTTGLLECPVYKAFLTKERLECEERFVTKEGRQLDVYISTSPIVLEGGEDGYVVLFHDISEKKRIERERDAFSTIMRNTEDIVVIKDLNLRVIATNQAFARAAGKERIEELIGKTDAQIFGVSEDEEPIKGYMEDERKAQSLPEGHSLLREEEVVYPNGAVRVFKTRKFPIYKNGHVFATANISMDVTDERNYAKNLELKISQEMAHRLENETFYGKIFETANLGICLTDQQGRFVAVNPAYCEIYGYKEFELVGKPFTIVVPEENREQMQELHDRFLIDGKEELGSEWEVVRKDGKRIHIYASAGILRNIVGGPYKITTVSDVTELKEARIKQQEQEAMLIQQSKLAAMGEMLGHIAHQWRQPLNIINCTTLDIKLKKDMGILDDGMLNHALLNIEGLTDQMSETINDFMDFYKPSKHKSYFSLLEAIEGAQKIIAPQLKSHKISLSMDVQKDLTLYGPPGEVQQVILNLIANAKEAFMLGKGAQNRQLCIIARADGAKIVCSVEDNAGGIPETVIKKIFEPYYTTKGESGGTGIGLYMCAMIMKQSFGGTIHAENITNAIGPLGARFVLHFPFVQEYQ